MLQNNKIDFIFGFNDSDIGADYIYDIEAYPNIFTLAVKKPGTNIRYLFEISDRKNDIHLMVKFLLTLSRFKIRMVGFNNIGFDYPVLHFILSYYSSGVTLDNIYKKVQSIITCNNRFENIIYDNHRVIEQIDLYLIHHFDNVSKSTSLKKLENNMRLSIEDLPFPPNTYLSNDQKDILIKYNHFDVDSTEKFYFESLDEIKFREDLSEEYGKNFINFNDTKIGKEIFILKLEQHNKGCCYQYTSKGRKPRQTERDSISFKDVIFPYIDFKHEALKKIYNMFMNKTITETKGSLKDISCVVNDFKFVFGTGGIHGSIKPCTVYSDEEYIIEDWDVASYYPNIAISNNLHPKHLGEDFCKIYNNIYIERKKYKKNSVENKAFKLALNGTYGASNDIYSPFYDPKFTMSITVNGQLLLCVLAEQLIQLESLSMIQINTDGLTIRYPKYYKDWVHSVCRWWENLTNLTLENVTYNRMFIRDVNNYIAEYDNGDVKRKGAYEYKLNWHQNFDALVVKKAAEAYLLKGVDPAEFIKNHDDIFDFMLCLKVPRNSYIEHGGVRQQNIVRYFVSNNGDYLEKVMPPKGPEGAYKRANKLSDNYYNSIMEEIGEGIWDERIHTKNKSRYEWRRSEVVKGYTVELYNNVNVQMKFDFNYDWYVNEVNKITKPLMKVFK